MTPEIPENRTATSGVSSTMSDVPIDLTGARAPVGLGADATVDVPVAQSIDVAYRRMYPSLVRLAILLVDSREQAEEIVQDAFSRAYPRWHRITNHEAYLRSTVLNLCRKVHRRRAVARRAPHDRPVDAPGADEVADHVVDAVRALSSPMREMVVLRYYAQASDTEIAATLRLPVGTVKSTLHRARSILRKELS